MRILVYGMQSSGASLFTYLLAQTGRQAIVDLWNPYVAPKADRFPEETVCKVVATTIPYEDHLRSFKPDKTILFLRNPEDNWVRLCKKAYSKEMGSIQRKFKQLERTHKTQEFDHIIRYEDMVDKPEKLIAELSDLGLKAEHFDFPLSTEAVVKNGAENKWISTYYQKRWGFGNIHSGQKIEHPKSQRGIVDPTIKMKLHHYCPNILKLYGL